MFQPLFDIVDMLVMLCLVELIIIAFSSKICKSSVKPSKISQIELYFCPFTIRSSICILNLPLWRRISSKNTFELLLLALISWVFSSNCCFAIVILQSFLFLYKKINHVYLTVKVYVTQPEMFGKFQAWFEFFAKYYSPRVSPVQ